MSKPAWPSGSGGHVVDATRYLARLGFAHDEPPAPGLDWLERLQYAHVTTVPFENLSITGYPFDDQAGPGVDLALEALFEKIVADRRGGFCYELNGLFGWLLTELGFDTHRLAAMVIGDDGDVQPPANHHTNLVRLDRPYIVDVGLGLPTLRRPVPLDGDPIRDGAGVEWRTAESDRPDTDSLMQFREAPDEDWTDRYYFSTTPRDLSYFRAPCDFLQSAPESPFTGDPIVTKATESGHLKLTRDRLIHRIDGQSDGRAVEPDDWPAVADREFDLQLRDTMPE